MNKENNFWELISELIGSEIPKYLVNLLTLRGFDSIISIKQLDKEDISQLENYARTEKFWKRIPKDASLHDYFGIYHDDSTGFEILPGHKKLLTEIVFFVQQNFTSQCSRLGSRNYGQYIPAVKTKTEVTVHVDSIATEVETPVKTSVETEVDGLIKENDLLQKNLNAALNTIDTLTDKNQLLQRLAYPCLNLPENATLKMLVVATEQNSKRHKNGYRHSDRMKMFTSYIKMLGGKLLYEFLHANLSMTFPSPSTDNRFMLDNGPNVIEGVLRVKELKAYLEERNFPLAVVISEDATRNVGRICYNSSINQLVGFVLPLDSDGMPIPKSFPARNAKEIEEHFKNENNTVATMSISIMAQPLKGTADPFCLTIFSTDNKFTADQVVNRWRCITERLQQHGINANVYASDGDSRLVKAMKAVTEIGTSSEIIFHCKWFNFGAVLTGNIDGIYGSVYFQDATHVIGKCRNRLLKPSSIIPMGNKVVSNSHLRFLIEKISKDKHLLTFTDIEPKDRQNFRSAEKISNARTRQCLKEYVPGSEATILYLKMMNFATSPILDPKMEIDERIRKIWYSVFFCRIFRSWLLEQIKIQNRKTKLEKLQIKLRSFVKTPQRTLRKRSKTNLETNRKKLDIKSYKIQKRRIEKCSKKSIELKSELKSKNSNESRCKIPNKEMRNNGKRKLTTTTGNNRGNNFTLQECFISSNTYTCIEINAHSLVKFIIKLRRNNEPSLFVPTLLGSQACKSSFRQLRAMTTTFSTVINFTVYDMLHRVNKIQLQNDIMSKCTWLKFPRNDQRNASMATVTELPTNCEIIALIEEARMEAIKDASSVGMYSENIDLCCQIVPTLDCNLHENPTEINEDDSDDEDTSEHMLELNEINDEEELADLQNDIHILSSISGSLSMRDYSESKNVLSEKSPYTFVTDSTGKNFVVRKSSICWLLTKSKHSLSSDRLLRVRDNEFNKQKKVTTSLTKDNLLQVNYEVYVGEWCLFLVENHFLLGLILSYCYLNGTTYRAKEYSRNFACVSSDREIGVLCNWYSWNTTGLLHEESKIQFFVNIKNYRAAISAPTFESNCLRMEHVLVKKINEFVKVS